MSLKAYQEWQLHGGPRLWKAIGGGSFRTPCPLKHLTKSGSGRHTENHHPSSQQYCQIRESSRKRFPFDETSSPFSGQSVRFGQSRGQSNDEFLDEIGKCSFSLHLISILSLFNRFHLCVFFLFIYLVWADFSSVWAQHVSQRFSEAIRANGKASQEEILIDQMPDTPHSSLEVCFSIMCQLLWARLSLLMELSLMGVQVSYHVMDL